MLEETLEKPWRNAAGKTLLKRSNCGEMLLKRWRNPGETLLKPWRTHHFQMVATQKKRATNGGNPVQLNQIAAICTE